MFPFRKTVKLWLTCMLAVSYMVECLYRLQKPSPNLICPVPPLTYLLLVDVTPEYFEIYCISKKFVT